MFLMEGCQSTTNLGTDAQRPYQWEELSHHPALVWHRHRADSALVHVKLPAHEPLHLRESRDLPFRFSLVLDLVVATLDVPDTDSLRVGGGLRQYQFTWTGTADPERDALEATFSFPLAEGRYRITHTLRDVHRGAQVSGAVLLDGWSEDAPVRCLAFDMQTGEPAWGGQLVGGHAAGLLVPPDLAQQMWWHAAIGPVDSFPSAPFLDRKPAEMRFPDAVEQQLPLPVDPHAEGLPPGDWTGWSLLQWDNAPGVHQWTLQGSRRHVVLPARRAHFPRMRDLDEMIRATRYIATRDEYKAMRESRNPKDALDRFWLQFAENPEEARMLIRNYYGRIHEANVHFSGLREGWSTDRGLVYVVFGHPDRTRRDRFGETWIYGEEGDVNALIYRFSTRPSGDDFNVYELERYPGFRSPWEAMVSSWRRGRIRKR